MVLHWRRGREARPTVEMELPSNQMDKRDGPVEIQVIQTNPMVAVVEMATVVVMAAREVMAPTFLRWESETAEMVAMVDRTPARSVVTGAGVLMELPPIPTRGGVEVGVRERPREAWAVTGEMATAPARDSITAVPVVMGDTEAWESPAAVPHPAPPSVVLEATAAMGESAS